MSLDCFVTYESGPYPATSNYCVQLTAGRLVGVIATAALARRS
jgi:hypothetical protein